jgi:hypothetical protein
VVYVLTVPFPSSWDGPKNVPLLVGGALLFNAALAPLQPGRMASAVHTATVSKVPRRSRRIDMMLSLF